MSHESQIAAARAFLEAGNFKLAIKHAEEVLQKDPENSRALEVLGDTLLKTNEHQRLEELSVSWLGRDPSAGPPHMFLFFCYLQRKDQKMARALLDHFSTACPGNKREIDMFEAAFKTKFGKPEEGFDSLARIYAADGDKRSAFKFNSLAALKRQNLSEAITEGEFARRSGDVSAGHLSYLAMLCYRTFRFAKCRAYARQALAADRSLDIPRELIVLSYLVWFPPFLIGHAAMYLLTGASNGLQRFIAGIGLWFLGLPALVFSYYVLNVLLSALHLPNWTNVALVFGYALYMPFIGTLSRLLKGRVKTEVTLGDY